ncbi:hypothetical protein [Haloprofundus sp. MHR1]|uniref:hypothetical protein n=1 Tax=Haloprofundus sp. MHR1 TaxID=2572921 RepID=UPI0010BEC72D|nr:hypothetical protein [Haloprofundus sp. MHR1]QCJ45891.1 hypothetical protein FCF25_01600 [Haloprofundus sp. MHR1]
MAVSDQDTTSRVIDLVPDIRIVDITQYRGGDRISDLSKLAVTVENIGTAPTWVYDITYRDAPNAATNDELIDGAGIPYISIPQEPDDLILLPDDQRTYVGTRSPLLLRNQRGQTCNGHSELTVVVGTASGDSLEQHIEATLGGDVHSVGLTDEYVCSDVSTQPAKSSDSDV